MKRVKLLLLALLTGIILVGCSSSKLSDAFDEATLKERGKEVVDFIINEEYDKISAQMSDKMKEAASPEELEKTLKDTWDSVKGKLGEFEKISKEGIVGAENLASVIEVAKFKNGKIQFTINYNENIELEGIFLK
ncbi:DUF3887 domain-containing protein [Clostridium sp. CCUG 7971]|uniref:DUF3887 domain-containing protein n=1 Tax=Clostridium sp. CCUG 7971 TaxID=2811414 RepID=UPI001ABB7567|nr:DUF3887 domain-containing protein [Clostridium sp. CCUG 7971]MBO3446195.1 DUF3887 domain-containing protein [Clostridium sp. CCUG 7971]